MKQRILVTGKGSYIGTKFKEWISQRQSDYEVEELSVRGTEWELNDFSKFDVIIHVAAIVHKREKNSMKNLYFEVNTELPILIAQKAMKAGVKQFIFMSSMAVYGNLNKNKTVITQDCPCIPTTFYGQSKLMAEDQLLKLSCENFKVSIIRAPMIYGPGCPGNYTRLSQLSIKIPFVPEFHNSRSMIFIDNLSEFIIWLIKHEQQGVFFPQNNDYINTTQLIEAIAKTHGKQLRKVKLLSCFIKAGIRLSSNIRKVFGSLIYDANMPGKPGTFHNGLVIEYKTVSFEESIRITEKSNREPA